MAGTTIEKAFVIWSRAEHAAEAVEHLPRGAHRKGSTGSQQAATPSVSAEQRATAFAC